MRNIDNFMEELKHEQELREKRHQERDKWRDGRQDELSAVSCSNINIDYQNYWSFHLLINLFTHVAG